MVIVSQLHVSLSLSRFDASTSTMGVFICLYTFTISLYFFLSWGRWRGKYVQTFVIYLNSNFILISLSFSTRRRRLRQCWWRRWLLHTFEFGHTFHINEGEMISCVNINNNLYALTLDHVLFFSFYDKLSPWLLKKVDKTKMTRKKNKLLRELWWTSRNVTFFI